MVARTLIRQKDSKEFIIKDNILIGDEVKSSDNRSVAQVLWETFDDAPDFVSQINADTGEKTTFAEIKDRSTRCALWLRKQGIGRDDIVAISTQNQNDDLIPYIATLFVGAIFNPWYHDLTDVNVRRFFKIYQPKVMFACEQSIDQLSRIAEEEEIACTFVVYGKHPKYPSLRSLFAEQTAKEVANFNYTVPNDPTTQCAIILFSSGTTGTPKGTMLSYDSINIRIEAFIDEKSKHYLWYSSLSWITGALLVLICIKLRTTRIIHGEFDPEKTGQVVENFKVSWTMWTPSMLTQCCKDKVFDRYDWSSLMNVEVGGSKLGKTIFEEAQRSLPHCLVRNGYGMTEAGGLIARQTHDRKRMDTAGYVGAGVKLKIVDTDTGRTLGPNQHGEICVKKRSSFIGYYNNPEETVKTLDRDGWVHTGDLGYYDEDGEITVVDRMKQLIIMQNFHVSPTEIEDILLKHPGVKECAVVPVPHEVDIERPFAFIVKFPGAKVTEEELKELPTKVDETYRLTGGIAFVDDLIYTSTGKKSLQLLKQKAKEYLSH